MHDFLAIVTSDIFGHKQVVINILECLYLLSLLEGKGVVDEVYLANLVEESRKCV